MYPHERSLVKKMQNKPFALVGVNSDTDREQLKEVLKKENITWRSFWAGEGGGQGNDIAAGRADDGFDIGDRHGVMRRGEQCQLVIAGGQIGAVRSVTLSTFRNTHAKGVEEWRPDWRRERRQPTPTV